MSITPDELERIIGHMNDDHGDALVRYAHAFANRKDVTAAKMIDLTETEIVLALENDERLAIPLTSPVQTAKDAHVVLVEMAKQAHSLLAAKTD
ncbi:hypothetical protein AVO42_07060 [Thiomicrospira sp. XS5]|uniref:DUF2470 domain-containing protein n=1 Tax=Thiomicrospira sp. XS5 TaxID=1775636 RepID=UPI0007495C11|nr:DUF2470 domain-containing protein [Thiomicrospira sp. XS5]KUJ75106.1 hypothetical protein AVO42_07060 [Thiomicrospira sp. XS5]